MRSLALKKQKIQAGTFLVEGPQTIGHLIKRGYPLIVLYLGETDRLKYVSLAREAEKRSIPIQYLSSREMGQLSETRQNQGIIAVAAMRVDPFKEGGLTVYLDGVQDPGNVGAVLRSAAAAGFENVLAGPGTADFFNSKTVRGSSGALTDLSLLKDSAFVWLPKLKSEGYQIVVSGANEGISMHDFQMKRKTVLVMGSEGAGVSSAIREQSDVYVHIPMKSDVQSLNIAVAFGILAFFFASKHLSQ